jgi:imidazolonepropionase-like amidohydrolase
MLRPMRTLLGLLLFQAVHAPLVQPFVSVDAPVFALRHVRVVDGTGGPVREDQTIVVRDGRIAAVGGPATALPSEAKAIDLPGRTVIPGLVGMHEHLFYASKLVPGPTMLAESFFNEQAYSFPRLYLAAGVTTARTAGSIEPYLDLAVRRQIEAGEVPGPRFDITAPYVEGPTSIFAQMNLLADAAAVRRFVEYWADAGATSFKVYNYVSRAQLAAAIEAAHRRKLKVAAHLCSVGFSEAAALGVDSLEHGLITDTEFVAGRKPDQCVQGRDLLAGMKVEDPRVQALIRTLVTHRVAIGSTLAVFESAFRADRIDPRGLALMIPETRASVEAIRARRIKSPRPEPLATEMAFERAFAKAGGLLIAGADPTGYGAVLAGFGDQRNLELLVEAGFTPVESITIGTANGARYLERDDIGTIAAGKRADLVVIAGDPSRQITDIEKVETVFKDGLGYDSKKLIESVRGNVGLR